MDRCEARGLAKGRGSAKARPLRFGGEIDGDVVVFNFDGVGVEVLACGTAQDFAIADVETCTVPRAGYDAVGKLSLVEGAADVCAVVGKCVDSAFY